MALEAMDICLQLLKESNKTKFDSYSVRNRLLIIFHLPFGIVGCTFFLTTFLEIVVCTCLGDHWTARDFKEVLYLSMGPRQPYLTEIFESVFG